MGFSPGQNVPFSSAASASRTSSAGLVLSAGQQMSLRVSPLTLPSLKTYHNCEPGADGATLAVVREFQASIETNEERSHSITSFLVCRESFGLTAGTDRFVRYWDLKEPGDSYVVSALSEPALLQSHMRCNGQVENSTVVVLEETVATPADLSDSKSDADILEMGLQMKRVAAAANRGPVAPRSCHADCITDMKAIEFPSKMLVTASRDASIKVWN
jgi:hypothetical protein